MTAQTPLPCHANLVEKMRKLESKKLNVLALAQARALKRPLVDRCLQDRVSIPPVTDWLLRQIRAEWQTEHLQRHWDYVNAPVPRDPKVLPTSTLSVLSLIMSALSPFFVTRSEGSSPQEITVTKEGPPRSPLDTCCTPLLCLFRLQDRLALPKHLFFPQGRLHSWRLHVLCDGFGGEPPP